jgi:hypothetical protein
VLPEDSEEEAASPVGVDVVVRVRNRGKGGDGRNGGDGRPVPAPKPPSGGSSPSLVPGPSPGGAQAPAAGAGPGSGDAAPGARSRRQGRAGGRGAVGGARDDVKAAKSPNLPASVALHSPTLPPIGVGVGLSPSAGAAVAGVGTATPPALTLPAAAGRQRALSAVSIEEVEVGGRGGASEVALEMAEVHGCASSQSRRHFPNASTRESRSRRHTATDPLSLSTVPLGTIAWHRSHPPFPSWTMWCVWGRRDPVATLPPIPSSFFLARGWG